MNCIGIIPARFASSRFPGKPLVLINGKSMIQMVYERASMAESLTEVIVATDDQRIFDHVDGFGGKVVMTSSEHQSGTDRIIEVVGSLQVKPDIIVNIQGDEPFIQPEQIDQLTSLFTNPEVKIGTLIKRIENNTELFSPNVVKAIKDSKGKALYFSRAAIPFIRGIEADHWLEMHLFFKHIGIYAFRSNILTIISQLKPSQLEKAESLEQLRWLENDLQIHCMETHFENIAIDTPADLEKVINNLK